MKAYTIFNSSLDESSFVAAVIASSKEEAKSVITLDHYHADECEYVVSDLNDALERNWNAWLNDLYIIEHEHEITSKYNSVTLIEDIEIIRDLGVIFDGDCWCSGCNRAYPENEVCEICLLCVNCAKERNDCSCYYE